MDISTRTEARTNKLYELGLKFNGQECIKDDLNIHWTEIACDTDEEFDSKIEKIRTEMNFRQGQKT